MFFFFVQCFLVFSMWIELNNYIKFLIKMSPSSSFSFSFFSWCHFESCLVFSFWFFFLLLQQCLLLYSTHRVEAYTHKHTDWVNEFKMFDSLLACLLDCMFACLCQNDDLRNYHKIKRRKKKKYWKRMESKYAYNTHRTRKTMYTYTRTHTHIYTHTQFDWLNDWVTGNSNAEWKSNIYRHKHTKYIYYTIIKFVFRCWGFYFVLIWGFFSSFLVCLWRRQKSHQKTCIYNIIHVKILTWTNTCQHSHTQFTHNQMWKKDRYLCTRYRAHARTSHKHTHKHTQRERQTLIQSKWYGWAKFTSMHRYTLTHTYTRTRTRTKHIQSVSVHDRME